MDFIVQVREGLTLYLFWHSDQEYPRLGKVKGYPEHPELDAVIQFWLNYWKEAGLTFPKDLDPFMIKILIAVESFSALLKSLRCQYTIEAADLPKTSPPCGPRPVKSNIAGTTSFKESIGPHSGI